MKTLSMYEFHARDQWWREQDYAHCRLYLDLEASFKWESRATFVLPPHLKATQKPTDDHAVHLAAIAALLQYKGKSHAS